MKFKNQLNEAIESAGTNLKALVKQLNHRGIALHYSGTSRKLNENMIRICDIEQLLDGIGFELRLVPHCRFSIKHTSEKAYEVLHEQRVIGYYTQDHDTLFLYSIQHNQVDSLLDALKLNQVNIPSRILQADTYSVIELNK
jgi:hypothetical protein